MSTIKITQALTGESLMPENRVEGVLRTHFRTIAGGGFIENKASVEGSRFHIVPEEHM
jgi:hypothetical protein